MQLVTMLEDSGTALHASAAGVPDSMACRCPAVGRWTILECVEHVGLVEEKFLLRLQGAERLAEPARDEQNEARLAGLAEDRAQRFEAPAPVAPAGCFKTVAEALAYFQEARAQNIRFALDNSAALHHLTMEHPRFGVLNGAELLVIAASHARRHAAQILEIRAALAVA